MESTNPGPGGALVAGRYRLHPQLDGTAGTSRWRATDELTGRVVGVRRIALSGLPSAEAASLRDRVLRDARAAGHHPNLVVVFDVVVEAGELWVVQEYLPAPTLADVLAGRGPLPAGEVAAIGTQVASALAAAHAVGVVHGNLGPADVLLAWPAAKLDGFGTAPPGADRGGDVHALGVVLDRAVDRREAGPLVWPLMSLLAPDPRARPTAAQAEAVLRDVALARPAGRRSGRRVAFGLVAALAAAALVAAAITIAPGGTGPQAATPAPDAGSAPVALSLGDPRTADPCSLVDEPALRRHGTIDIEPHIGPLASCWAYVAVRPQTEVRLTVELSSTAYTPEGTVGVREKRGPLRLVRYAFNSGYCTRNIYLPDSGAVVVAVDTSDDVDEQTICAVADTGVDSVVERLLRAGVSRRATPNASTVLVNQDACRLLTAGDLTAVAGSAPSPVAGPGNWSCRWRASSGADVAVTFVRQYDGLATGETPIDIGGRPSRLYRFPTADECGVTVPQQRFDGMVEGVWVVVYDPRPGADTCGAATATATAVAARLPPPS